MVSTNQCHIGKLPEELIIHVLEYLDTRPPSETHIRREPSLSLTACEKAVYKDVCCVSKAWRRIALPLLFKHVRLRLDVTPKPHWARCLICNEFGLQKQYPGSIHSLQGSERDHAEMMADVRRVVEQCRRGELAEVFEMAEDVRDTLEKKILKNASAWIPRFYHGVSDILDFLVTNKLTTCVTSFVLMTGKMLDRQTCRYPHMAAPTVDWRFKAAAALWQHVLSVVNPPKILILAPPMDLACLTNCAIDTFGDWAFGDMEFHVVELQTNGSGPSGSVPAEALNYSSLEYMPHRFPGLAQSSILNLRPWSSININEGAFLKAYGTYEYFERGPPSLIYSIKDSFSPSSYFDAHARRISRTPLVALRKLTYTAIFPFANHLDFHELLPQLEELDLQLAPDVDSNILTQPERVGKAELQDCWSELCSIYQNIASQLATFRISAANMPRLKRFVCRDSKIAALRDDLDEIFIPLCLPVWVETLTGEFTRVAKNADVLGIQTLDW